MQAHDNVVYIHHFNDFIYSPLIPQEQINACVGKLMQRFALQSQPDLSTQEQDTLQQTIQEHIQKYAIGPQYISHRQFSSGDPLTYCESEAYPNVESNAYGLSLGDRMKYFDTKVGDIFDGLYQAPHTKPDALIHVSCSGYLSPSPAQKFINRNAWHDVQVIHSYHMGCYGAFPPLKMAAGLLSHALLLGQPIEQVDIAHTELLTLHLDISSYTPGNIINMTLFGDGFIKYSVGIGRRDEIPDHSLKLLATHDQLIKNSTNDMTWIPNTHQFDMYLSIKVPVRINAIMKEFVAVLCAKANIDFEKEKDAMIVAVHPGGPKIVNDLQANLGLTDRQLSYTRDVLYEHGNMSSSTIPHIWKRIAEDPEVAPGTKILTMAFGPGLTATGFILERK